MAQTNSTSTLVGIDLIIGRNPPTVGKHAVVFALNANSHIRAPVLSVHNEDIDKNIYQIPSILDVDSLWNGSFSL